MAVFGITSQYATPQHIIISAVEHSAIALPAQMLEDKGWQVTRLPVNRKGRVNPQDLAQAIQDNTVFSINYLRTKRSRHHSTHQRINHHCQK